MSLKKNKFKRNKDSNTDLINSKSVELIPQTIEEKNENGKEKDKDKKYIERTNRFANYNKFNTVKMMVDKNKPFNYRGKIDIIVEE